MIAKTFIVSAEKVETVRKDCTECGCDFVSVREPMPTKITHTYSVVTVSGEYEEMKALQERIEHYENDMEK